MPAIKQFAGDQGRFNYWQDSTHMPLRMVMDLYVSELQAAEVAMSEYKGMGVHNDEEYIRQRDISTIDKFYLLDSLWKTGNFRGIDSLMREERETPDSTGINYQAINNSFIAEQQDAVEKYDLLTLLFYAIGIILITIDRMKEAVRRERESNGKSDDEIKNLLNQVITQNNKILAGKRKGK